MTARTDSWWAARARASARAERDRKLSDLHYREHTQQRSTDYERV